MVVIKLVCQREGGRSVVGVWEEGAADENIWIYEGGCNRRMEKAA